MKYLIHLFCVFFTITLSAQEITGDWSGMLNAPGAKLRLVFHITKTTNGYASTMDSPDQRATGIPITQTSFENAVLKLTIGAGVVQYEGILGQDSIIKGNFKQNGMTIPLDLARKTLQASVINRPQEPSKPYPYSSEDVIFPNKAAGLTLAGTLTTPNNQSNYPTVILISGSGAQNRNGEVFGHKPFLVLADYLTKKGIAVLRFDDRGIAKSTGNFASATTNDFATDVEAALEYLLTKKEIDKKKIGLIGHSEGGIIAPIVAAKRKDVSFIVLLAGAGIPGGEILTAQTEILAKASGAQGEELAQGVKFHRDMMDFVRASKDSASLAKDLSVFFHTAIKENPATQKSPGQTDEENIRTQIVQLTSPWMINFIKYDPSLILEKVRCPVLALNGSKDIQVPAAQNLAAIKKGLEKGSNKSVTIKEIPGLNHLFQESTTGMLNEYGSIEQTFSPLALIEIDSWIIRLVGAAK